MFLIILKRTLKKRIILFKKYDVQLKKKLKMNYFQSK
jgi:hypothetical protein